MKAGILGTGVVGRAIAAKLVELEHDVMLGTRNVQETVNRTKGDNYGNPSFKDWIGKNPKVHVGTFAQAATFGEILVNATSGGGAIEALTSVAETSLSGKTMIDISNPLDFSKGFPPFLSIVNTDSLGETIQRTFPALNVVKALNTVNAMLMVNPALVNGGDHDLFVCGNNTDAKQQAVNLLVSFGWKAEHLIDLGDITNARATEQLLPIWVRLFGKFQSPMFQFKIVK